MRSAAGLVGRLPGVRCDPALPRPVDDRIRLDVAAFVGVAERGPLDDPQPVDDPGQYTAIFGGDVMLAVDHLGEPVRAGLPGAVTAFFDNGGRRAHVVRVAGSAATVEPSVRVVSRSPLDASRAIVGLSMFDADTAVLSSTPAPTVPFTCAAATPGRWASQAGVDIDVDTVVLALATDTAGIGLTADARRQLDEGDAVLVRRADRVDLVWTPPIGTPPLPPGGWLDGDVAYRARVTMTVHLTSDDGRLDIVERLGDLRLGPGVGRSRYWHDALQPHHREIGAPSVFDRGRSMFLRGPDATHLVPDVGPRSTPIPDATPNQAPPPASREALAMDGLETFDPVALYVDDRLRNQTVDSLRTELERYGLDDDARLRGIHSLTALDDVSILAMPDLYHRPWSQEAIVAEPPLEPLPDDDRDVPVGFIDCTRGGSAPPPPTSPPRSPVPPPPSLPDPVEAAVAQLRMVVADPDVYDPGPLHETATAATLFCAARSDMVAVLALPRHAGVADAEALASALRQASTSATDVASHAGIWHPWGAIADDRRSNPVTLRAAAPDGAIVGTIAGSERARGWWVEPAGLPLAGLADLDTGVGDMALELFVRGFNPIVRQPGGYVPASAHTCSIDDLLQVSVRRLLIWVRRLVTREGARMVFERDNDRVRVQLASLLRRHLEQLRSVGALAAYDVEVAPLRAQTASEEGSVRIDVRLAPTTPIEFVTVSLVRSGDGLITMEPR